MLPSGGDHDRIEPCHSVGNPSVECIFSGGGQVADMNTAVIKVEVERLWLAIAEGERGCRFGGVGEAVQLGQAEAPWVWVMSRRRPPAPIAASC